MDRLGRILSVFAILGLCFGVANTMAAEKRPAKLAVKAGSVQGKVADSIGNAVAKQQIRITTQDGKVVAEATTDADGQFDVELKKGHYKMAVGDLRVFALDVKATSSVTELALIVPTKDYSAGQAASGAAGGGMFGWATSSGGFLGLSTAGVAAAGAGTAAVVGGGIAAADSGGSSGGDDDPVSPE